MTGPHTMIGRLRMVEMVLLAEKAARLAPAQHPVVVVADSPLGRLLSASLPHSDEDRDRLLAWWDGRRPAKMTPPLAGQDRARLTAAEAKRARKAANRLRVRGPA